MRTIFLGLFLGTWLFQGGCSSGLVRLPDNALLGLPTEGRRWIFDAENAVVAALDAVDVAGEELREAERISARAEQSVKIARAQEPKRGTNLGIKAAEAHLSACRVAERLAGQRLILARQKVGKARADLELDKARLVVTYDLVAVRGFSLEPFEAQAQSAARRVESAQQEADVLAKKLQEHEDAALSARKGYIAQSGDHDSGVWLD